MPQYARGAGTTPLTSSSTSPVDIPHQRRVGKTVKISAYQATFSTETSASGGSASSPTPVYSGSGLRNGVRNKAIRAHHHQRSIVARTAMQATCVAHARSTPSWLSCGMNLHFRHHRMKRVPNARHCWIYRRSSPPSDCIPSQLPPAPIALSSSAVFQRDFRLNKHLPPESLPPRISAPP